MTPINHLAPKGSHLPLIEYVGTPPERLGRREGPKSFARGAKDDRAMVDPIQTVSEYLEQKTRDLRASCYLGDLTCLRLARISLCREVRQELGLILLYRSACKLLSTTKAI